MTLPRRNTRANALSVTISTPGMQWDRKKLSIAGQSYGGVNARPTRTSSREPARFAARRTDDFIASLLREADFTWPQAQAARAFAIGEEQNSALIGARGGAAAGAAINFCLFVAPDRGVG